MIVRLPFPWSLAVCVVLLPCTAAHAGPSASRPAAGTDATSAAIEIVLPDARTVPLSEIALEKIARHALSATAHGRTSTFEGRELIDVLQAAGVRPVESLKGPQLRTLVTVTGRDGTQVVFALAELDPTIGGRQVMVADRVDGAALEPKEGPWRLVVPEDQSPARWIGQVARIAVSNAGP